MSTADVNSHVRKFLNASDPTDVTEVVVVVAKYNDYTALEFTEVVSVMVWIWTVALLTQVVVVTVLEQWKPSATVNNVTNSVNVRSKHDLYQSLHSVMSL
jgi:hypothetical protein